MTYTNKQHKQYELQRYHKRRLIAINQLGGKCFKCGTTENLEFDHIDPELKDFNIAKLWSYSQEKFELELKKCQLLCNKCHKEKTKNSFIQKREHGTWGMYRRGKCKCDICREFFNDYRRKWRLKTGRTKSSREN